MIKLVNLSIGKTELENVIRVLSSGHMERGKVTIGLENTLQNTFRSSHAVVVANGTAALFSGFLACGISKGDEIITTPLSFIATVNAILLCGAIPIFVDIDRDTFNIDVTKIERAINKKTKAIFVVDLYGCPAEYDKLRNLADKYRLLLISDSCQAIGAQYRGRFVNEYADITAFSFFNSKNISSGEGGALLTNNTMVADKVNLLINHGQKRGEKYNYLCAGWNFRPTDLQSTIIMAQLKRLEVINRKRRLNSAYLIKHLSTIRGLLLPKAKPHLTHVYSRFTIQITDEFSLSRDELQQHLYKEGVETEIAYPKPMYEHAHTRQYKNNRCPVVEKAVKQILSLPIHQNLSKSELDHIIQVIKKASQ